MTGKGQDPPMSFLTERLQANADAQPMVSGCMWCPEFLVSGTAAEVREQSARHRSELHPETLKQKARRPKKRFMQKNMTRDREEAIEEERRQRLRVLGLPVEE